MLGREHELDALVPADPAGADDEVGWLLEFRAPAHDPAVVGACEFAYARMAQAAGVEVAVAR